MDKTVLIGGFNKARTKQSVNLQASIDHHCRQCLRLLRETFVPFAYFVVHCSNTVTLR